MTLTRAGGSGGRGRGTPRRNRGVSCEDFLHMCARHSRISTVFCRVRPLTVTRAAARGSRRVVDSQSARLEPPTTRRTTATTLN
ncbi:hypothetical protein EVAR_57386_1 [Eumeta japonica]|uniref:Uncharacterized protein n=1 Tax=Eumeta variegata TaxID=151549 RepID=A0A4C1ZI84_EUMVA|nr:hypothetical protein EVAR_57386_1 [Eumeta japonica]